MRIALLHPGEMGSAIGAALVEAGQEVRWSSAGRTLETKARASEAGLVDDVDLVTLLSYTELVVSVCPPHAALDVASEVAAATKDKRDWFYLDVNAIAPATARRVADVVEDAGAQYVDGGIIGPPPIETGTTRLYLSGRNAREVSEALATRRMQIQVIDERPGSASALKLAYAAWTKGSAALLLAVREAAAKAGVVDTLVGEWRISQPGLESRWEFARRSALDKGWRWSGEMREIASMLDEYGLPSGFHAAAALIFDDPSTVA